MKDAWEAMKTASWPLKPQALNPKAPVPLYIQLAEIISGKIRSAEFRPGQRIPSEHQLADAFGIGRPTVRQATELLVRRRLLERRRGSGTFVREPLREIDLFSLAGTTSAFAREGLEIDTRILRGPETMPISTGDDNPFAGGSAYFLSRLSRVDARPVLLEEFYLAPDVFPGLDRIDLHDRSLSQVVEEHYYLSPTGGRQSFRIDFPDAALAAVLGIEPGTPVLGVSRHLHFEGRDSAVYSDLYCRTDRFVFSQTLGGF